MIPRSSSPKKQRKWLYKDAKLHDRHKLLRATLSADLKKKYGKRNARLRKGDKVKILRGVFSGHEGKVSEVNMKNLLIKVEGATIKKTDGSEIQQPVKPSNVMITDLKMDNNRKRILER